MPHPPSTLTYFRASKVDVGEDGTNVIAEVFPAPPAWPVILAGAILFLTACGGMLVAYVFMFHGFWSHQWEWRGLGAECVAILLLGMIAVRAVVRIRELSRVASEPVRIAWTPTSLVVVNPRDGRSAERVLPLADVREIHFRSRGWAMLSGRRIVRVTVRAAGRSFSFDVAPPEVPVAAAFFRRLASAVERASLAGGADTLVPAVAHALARL